MNIKVRESYCVNVSLKVCKKNVPLCFGSYIYRTCGLKLFVLFVLVLWPAGTLWAAGWIFWIMYRLHTASYWGASATWMVMCCSPSTWTSAQTSPGCRIFRLCELILWSYLSHKTKTQWLFSYCVLLSEDNLTNFLFYLFVCCFFLSPLLAAEAAVSPSASHHPSGGSYLGSECVRGSTHDGAGEKPAG